MLLSQLTYFVRAVEAGSMSAAAAALRVSQPAVTIQIGKLEKELGTKLLLRDHAGVHLTPAGEGFFMTAKEVLARLDSSVADLARFRGSRASRVRLGVTLPSSRVLVTPLAEELCRSYPNVSLIIKQGTSQELRKWLEAGELDLVISPLDEPSVTLAAEPVVRQEFYLIGPRGRIAPVDKPIRFAELVDYPLIKGGIDVALLRRKALEKLAASRHIKLDFDFASPVEGRKQVMQTLGRCTISLHAHFYDDIAVGELIARPIRRPTLTQTLYLIKSTRRALDSAQLATYRLIKSQIDRVIRQGSYRWHPPTWRTERDSVEL